MSAAGCNTPFATHTEGVFLGLDEDVYRKAPGVCQSDLKAMDVSPAHYKAKVDGPRAPSSPAQVIGRVTHSTVLERKKGYVLRPAEFSDYRSKDARTWRDAQTLPVITKEDEERIGAMAESVWRHPYARAILQAAGNNEVSCFKRDEKTGLLLKGRADRVTEDEIAKTVVVDLKTCEEEAGGLEPFTREIFKWKYYRQGAFYTDLFGASFFCFIVVETAPPFAVAVYDLDPESIALGRRENERALSAIRQCEDSGVWPAYGVGIKTIGVPEWVKRKEGML